MTIELELSPKEDRIWLKSPYSPETVIKCRAASGSWAKSVNRWTFPVDLDKCKELREHFPDLVIGPKLEQWAWDEMDKRSTLGTISALDPTKPVDLPNVRELAPNIWAAMSERSYQTVASAFGVQAQRWYNGDEPGLGKTIETFGALIEGAHFGRWLVIAPSTSVVATWGPELERWIKPNFNMRVWMPGVKWLGKGTARSATPAEREAELDDYLAHSEEYDIAVCLVNAEMVRTQRADGVTTHDNPQLFSIEWDAMIGDEVHKYLLNIGGKNPTQVGLGFDKLRATETAMVVALSGTPMKGRPRNLWGGFRWLRPATYTSRWGWMEKRLVSIENNYTQSGKTFTDKIIPEKMADYEEELAAIMIRRTKDSLYLVNPGWAPPPKMHEVVWLPMTPKQRKIYNALSNKKEILLGEARLAPKGHLAMDTRLQQLACCAGRMRLDEYEEDAAYVPELPSNKLDWLVGTMLPSKGINPIRKNSRNEDEQLQDGTDKVVVASQYTKFINLWADELRRCGINCHVLTGQTNIGARAKMVEDFQSDNMETRVMLINTQAGGTSITLDAHCHDLVVMSETWVPDDQIQVEDRVHRTSNVKHHVTIWIVRSLDTIEQQVADMNAAKTGRNDAYLTHPLQRGGH
jgi:SNF2 family DNA or RNA helicase